MKAVIFAGIELKVCVSVPKGNQGTKSSFEHLLQLWTKSMVHKACVPSVVMDLYFV